jgi:hypothetical protein
MLATLRTVVKKLFTDGADARHPPTPARSHHPQSVSCSLEDDWFYAAAPLVAAKVALQRIEALQVAAGDQVDAAEYALQRLLGELGTAMAIPASSAPLRAVLAEAAKLDGAKRALAA